MAWSALMTPWEIPWVLRETMSSASSLYDFPELLMKLMITSSLICDWESLTTGNKSGDRIDGVAGAAEVTCASRLKHEAMQAVIMAMRRVIRFMGFCCELVRRRYLGNLFCVQAEGMPSSKTAPPLLIAHCFGSESLSFLKLWSSACS